ncbi:MAG TPA: flagellar hook-associated protein FlgL [Planctomycetota bacterium]|nr:flagellar hook-associated protein FlgL [Planctomycetota bacterium]
MTMRVTQGHLFRQVVASLRFQQASILRDQEQIASGKRINRPSDDPTGASRALALRRHHGDLERFAAAVVGARERLDAGASALDSLSDLLSQAKELGTKGSNGTLTQDDRDTIAKELDQILQQAVGLANSKDAYGYLFSGTGGAAPYQLESDGASYHGDLGTTTVPSGDSQSIVTGIPGALVFGKFDRDTSIYFGGNTGAKAGTGTDSAIDRGTLTVLHGATTLGDGALAGGDSVSGLKLGTSTAGDTVIGPAGAHTLAVDAVAGTISLNGGPAVSFTGSETDLAVTDANGAVVHVDVTGITAGFQGNVSIAATGFLSTDGGATQVAIDFSANQVVTGAGGAITNVDSTGIHKAGAETIDYVGTTDLFRTLAGLRDDLKNGSLSADQLAETLGSRMRELSRNLGNVTFGVADLGARSTRASDANDRLLLARDEIDSAISGVEDADYAEVVSRLDRATLSLQIAQAASQRILQTSILNLL